MQKCVIKKVHGFVVEFEADGKVVSATASQVFVNRDVKPFIGQSAFVEFKQLNGMLFFTKCNVDLTNAVDVDPFANGKEVDF